MDATTLRIILLILGLSFLAALYLWERRRAAADDEEDDYGYEDEDDAAGDGGHRGRRPEPLTDAQRAEREAALAERRRATDDLYLERFREPEDDGGAGDHAGADDALIVQFFLLARGGPFAGEEISEAAAHWQLVPGDMDIFHRRGVGAGPDRVRFSMANVVKPGIFPFHDLDNFFTPGLALFARLDGNPSDLMIYDELVQTAEAMAKELNADLLQSDRTPFDRAAAKRLRAQVLERLQAGGRRR